MYPRGFTILAALGLSAVFGLASARAADHIRVAIVSSLASAPFLVADAKGYFKDQGLEAELIHFDSAQPVAVAVTSGDVDFGSTGLTDAFFILANQGALKVIGAGTWERPGFYGLGVIVSNQAYDGGLKSFEGFSGHSAGITQLGTPLHYTLGIVLAKHGVDLKTVRVLALQSNPNVASAITGGQIDSAVLSSGNIFALVNKGNAHLMGWLADEFPDEQGDGTFTSTKLANERPDTVKHFLAAFRKAEKTWDDAFLDADGKRVDQPDAPAMIAIVAKGLGQPPEVVKAGIPYFETQSRVSVADIQNALNWYEAQGMQKVHIDAHAIIDTRYALLAPARNAP
jgi:NitT/TauT family transport system substrate-binding protein